MKRIGYWIMLFAMCFSLAACQYGPEMGQLQLEQNARADANGEYVADYDILDKGPVAGGELNLFTTAPDNLNPLLTKNAYVSDFLGLVYEGLATLDEKQQAAPELSDGWTVSSDGLIWTFHIRENVKWQDGISLTASDVEFTVQLLMNARVDSVYKPLVQNISTCAAVDSSSFKLVLNKPNAFLPEMMTFPILPKHQFGKTDILSASAGFKPIGTGPFSFESYEENKQVKLKANKDWWYLNTGAMKQKSLYIDAVNANVYKSTDDAMGALQSGDVDVMSVDSEDFAKYNGRTDLTVKKYTSRDFELISFNTNGSIFSDKYARKAVSLAIDSNRLITNALPGDAQEAEYPIFPDCWINELEGVKVDQSVLDAISNTTTNGGLAVTNTAVTAETPQEVLLQGGWKSSKQGFYKTIGGVRRYLKVELLVNSNNSTRVKAAQEVCSQLTQSGIQAVAIQLEWNEYLTRIYTAKYDAAFVGCRIPQIPDLSYLYSVSYLPVQLPLTSENARNITGYFNLQLDTCINGMFREEDRGMRKVYYKAALGQISDDMPYVGLYFKRNAMVYGKNLKGRMIPDTWNRYKDFVTWYKPQGQ